jgi:hypothetical protein
MKCKNPTWKDKCKSSVIALEHVQRYLRGGSSAWCKIALAEEVIDQVIEALNGERHIIAFSVRMMKCKNCAHCSKTHLSGGINIWCKQDKAIYERGYGCDDGKPSMRYLVFLKKERRKEKGRSPRIKSKSNKKKEDEMI